MFVGQLDKIAKVVTKASFETDVVIKNQNELKSLKHSQLKTKIISCVPYKSSEPFRIRMNEKFFKEQKTTLTEHTPFAKDFDMNNFFVGFFLDFKVINKGS